MTHWQAQVHIKQFLTNEKNLTSEQYREIGTQMASQLKRCSLFTETTDAKQIIEDLEHAESQEEVNEQLEMVYDVCDRQRIWCK